MKQFQLTSAHLTPILLAVAALVSACSSVPTTTSLLDQTRSDYRMAQANPAVVNYAPVELNQAGVALEQANAAASQNDSLEKIDQLAYVARQKIALSQEIARKKVAEADAATATKERSLVQLDQRTNEANKAKASAEQSKAEAQVAQGQAADAQRNAADAQRNADEARRSADEARRKTEAAQVTAQQTQVRNAQLEAQLAELAAKKTERGLIITLGDVLFGTGLARLSPDGVRTVQKLADVLQQNPQRRVLVEGFTDSTGTTAHNQDLSERRAGAVQTALHDMGITRDRVAMRGYGESYPVASNDSTQDRQLNRRVEILLSDDTGRTVQR